MGPFRTRLLRQIGSAKQQKWAHQGVPLLKLVLLACCGISPQLAIIMGLVRLLRRLAHYDRLLRQMPPCCCKCVPAVAMGPIGYACCAGCANGPFAAAGPHLLQLAVILGPNERWAHSSPTFQRPNTTRQLRTIWALWTAAAQPGPDCLPAVQN